MSAAAIIACVGCVPALLRKVAVRFGGEQAPREMLADHGWQSREVGKKNETYLLAPGTKALGAEELRKALVASEFALSSAPCRMVRNPEGLPRGLHVLRPETTGWTYIPDDFASARQTVARAVVKKFTTLAGDPNTKAAVAKRRLRIEIVLVGSQKARLCEAAIRDVTPLLLQVVRIFALEDLRR